MWIVFLVFVVMCFALGVGYLIVAGERFLEELVHMDLYTESNGCAFWAQGERRQQLRGVKLSEAVITI